MMQDGCIVVDRGGSQYQDVLTGEMKEITCQEEGSCRPAHDEELEAMVQAGLIAGFDAFQVYLYPLPEEYRSPLD